MGVSGRRDTKGAVVWNREGEPRRGPPGCNGPANPLRAACAMRADSSATRGALAPATRSVGRLRSVGIRVPRACVAFRTVLRVAKSGKDSCKRSGRRLVRRCPSGRNRCDRRRIAHDGNVRFEPSSPSSNIEPRAIAVRGRRLRQEPGGLDLFDDVTRHECRAARREMVVVEKEFVCPSVVVGQIRGKRG